MIVQPFAVGGFPQAQIYMIAERAADIIKAQYGSKRWDLCSDVINMFGGFYFHLGLRLCPALDSKFDFLVPLCLSMKVYFDLVGKFDPVFDIKWLITYHITITVTNHDNWLTSHYLISPLNSASRTLNHVQIAMSFLANNLLHGAWSQFMADYIQQVAYNFCLRRQKPLS